uniref:Peptidoglycan recognition protein 1 n=1 Tax=Equus caballus TaxID=9796 RepID=A0A5F5Q2T7_HORSE
MSSPCALLAWTFLTLLGLGVAQEDLTPCSPIVPRREWRALPSTCKQRLDLPVRCVVVSHTAGSPCDTPASCMRQVQNVQHYHVRTRGWCDVTYNFLIGEDGLVYEGRGWDIQGAHAGGGWNSKSIGISFMGNYMDRAPPQRALRAAQSLLACGVARGALSPNYEVKGHRDVQQTLSPARVPPSLPPSRPQPPRMGGAGRTQAPPHADSRGMGMQGPAPLAGHDRVSSRLMYSCKAFRTPGSNTSPACRIDLNDAPRGPASDNCDHVAGGTVGLILCSQDVSTTQASEFRRTCGSLVTLPIITGSDRWAEKETSSLSG